jgi:hypothetical protein
MEDNTRREAPRARDPRSPFSTPEQTPPAEKPAAKPARRSSPPAVTFQPPAPASRAEGHTSNPSSGTGEQAPRRSQRKPVEPAAGPVPAQPKRSPTPPATETTPSTDTTPHSGTTSNAGTTPDTAPDPAPAKRATSKRAAPAKKAEPAKKAAPAKQTATKAAAAPETAAAPVKPAKKAPAKRPPGKKAAAPRGPIRPATESSTTAEQPDPATPGPATPATVPALATAPTEPVATEGPTAPPTSPEPVAPEPVAKPEPVATPEPVVRLRVVTTPPAPRQFDSLVEQLLAEPARSPEVLAEAAVRTFGPKAKDWADRTRATYPNATREALARLAVQQFVRSAGLRGGLGALAGPYTPIALATATVITHAELVLHLAAVHDLDPTDPQRAADLLKLASPGIGPIVAWVALSLLSRSLPGVGLIAAVLGARATADAVAVRTRKFYAEYSSQDSQASGSS